MDILIVTDQASVWSEFEKILTDRGHALQFVETKDKALAACKAKRYGALIWDAVDDALAHRDTVIEFLMIDATMHQCVVTDIDPEQFHDDTEGLGLLPALDFGRDAHAFLKSVQQVEETFAFSR